VELLIAVPLGFVLGCLIGLTGVGGGALVAPALYVILGRDYGESVALSLMYSLLAKIFSAFQHLRQGTLPWKLTLLYGLTGVPGAIVGSQVVYSAAGSARALLPFLMSGVLLLVSVLMLMESAVRAIAGWNKPFSPREISWHGALAIGGFQLVVGALMGLTSVGSGSLVILSMVYLFRMSAREIVGSNIVISLIMVVPAALTHYVAGGVDWRLLAALSVGSLGGAILGSKTAMLLPDRPLKLVITGLLVAGAVSTIAKAW